MRRIRHISKVIRAAFIFTVFYVGGAFFGLVVLPLCSLGRRDRDQRKRANHRVITGAFRWVLDLLRIARIFDFDPRRVDPRLPGVPTLVVVNHPTTIDVVAVLSVYRDAVVVIKDKIWNDRFLRFLFASTAHIHGGDGSLESGLRVVDEIRERLAAGFDVVIFPEGTRSPPRGIGPFMKGAFAVATQTGTDILPVVLTADPPALHKDAPWHALPEETVAYRLAPQALVRVKGRSTRQLLASVTELFAEEVRAVYGTDAAVPPRDDAGARAPTQPAA